MNILQAYSWLLLLFPLLFPFLPWSRNYRNYRNRNYKPNTKSLWWKQQQILHSVKSTAVELNLSPIGGFWFTTQSSLGEYKWDAFWTKVNWTCTEKTSQKYCSWTIILYRKMAMLGCLGCWGSSLVLVGVGKTGILVRFYRNPWLKTNALDNAVSWYTSFNSTLDKEIYTIYILLWFQFWFFKTNAYACKKIKKNKKRAYVSAKSIRHLKNKLFFIPETWDCKQTLASHVEEFNNIHIS